MDHITLKCIYLKSVRKVRLSKTSNFSQLTSRLTNDYGFNVNLTYEDTDGDLTTLATENDFQELLLNDLKNVIVHVSKSEDEEQHRIKIDEYEKTHLDTTTKVEDMNKANNTLIKNQNVIKAEDFPLTISTNATLIDKPPVPAERPYLMSKLINNNTRERHRNLLPLTKETKPKLWRWQRGEMLGQGAYGKVYLGLNLESGELMAVKQLDCNDVSHKELGALEHEVQMLRDLQHPNIVRYLGTDLNKDTFCIFLEYVPGGSIHGLLRRFGRLDEAVIRVYTRQLLLGLEYLHRSGIAHRDIKGANVLVTNDGTIKVADFGASKRMNNQSSVGGVKGTPLWMAPEVIKEQQTDKGWKKADVWSVGCTVIEMTTGKPPWSNYNNPVTAMYHIACEDSLPIFPETLSDTGRDFLKLCFQRDPSKRPDVTSLLLHPFVAHSGNSNSKVVSLASGRPNTAGASHSLNTNMLFTHCNNSSPRGSERVFTSVTKKKENENHAVSPVHSIGSRDEEGEDERYLFMSHDLDITDGSILIPQCEPGDLGGFYEEIIHSDSSYGRDSVNKSPATVRKLESTHDAFSEVEQSPSTSDNGDDLLLDAHNFSSNTAIEIPERSQSNDIGEEDKRIHRKKSELYDSLENMHGDISAYKKLVEEEKLSSINTTQLLPLSTTISTKNLSKNHTTSKSSASSTTVTPKGTSSVVSLPPWSTPRGKGKSLQSLRTSSPSKGEEKDNYEDIEEIITPLASNNKSPILIVNQSKNNTIYDYQDDQHQFKNENDLDDEVQRINSNHYVNVQKIEQIPRKNILSPLSKKVGPTTTTTNIPSSPFSSNPFSKNKKSQEINNKYHHEENCNILVNNNNQIEADEIDNQKLIIRSKSSIKKESPITKVRPTLRAKSSIGVIPPPLPYNNATPSTLNESKTITNTPSITPSGINNRSEKRDKANLKKEVKEIAPCASSESVKMSTSSPCQKGERNINNRNKDNIRSPINDKKGTIVFKTPLGRHSVSAKQKTRTATSPTKEFRGAQMDLLENDLGGEHKYEKEGDEKKKIDSEEKRRDKREVEEGKIKGGLSISQIPVRSRRHTLTIRDAAARKIQGVYRLLNPSEYLCVEPSVAATAIQSLFRGYKVRCEIKENLFENKQQRCNRILAGHKGRIHSLSIVEAMYHTRLLLSGGSGGTCRAWDPDTGDLLRVLKPECGTAVKAIQMIPQSNKIVIGCDSGLISIFDMERDFFIKKLEGHSGEIRAIAVEGPSNNTNNTFRIATSSSDGAIRIWDARIRKSCVHVLKGHSDDVRTLTIQPGTHSLISGSNDQSLKIWDLRTGRALKSIRDHFSAVTKVESIDEDYFISCSRDTSVKLWKSDGTCRRTFKGHSGAVTGLALTGGPSIDTKLAASCSSDSTVRIWDINTGRNSHTFIGHVGTINDVIWLPNDKKLVASVGNDCLAKIWSLNDGGVLMRSLVGHSTPVTHICSDIVSGHIVTGSTDGSIRLWELNQNDNE